VEYLYPDTPGIPPDESVKDTRTDVSEPLTAVATREDGADPTRFVVAVPETSDRDSHAPSEIALRRIEY